jgi:hypothetical protein
VTTWKLFLDDIREPSYVYRDSDDPEVHPSVWTVARSTEEAKAMVQAKGMPSLISFDHDLGGNDTAMVFLGWLAREYWDGESPIPMWKIHSDNPVGRQNIRSFMRSWHESAES